MAFSQPGKILLSSTPASAPARVMGSHHQRNLIGDQSAPTRWVELAGVMGKVGDRTSKNGGIGQRRGLVWGECE